MNNYTQITRDERAIISDLWIKGKSYYYIANWLGRKYDTIRNEIERNGRINQFGKLIYSSQKAHKRYLNRRKQAKRKERIIENNFTIEEVLTKLITKEQFSPEEIAGRYDTISHQTIYNWIYRMTDYELKKYIVSNLRRKGKKYRKTSKLHNFESVMAPKTMIDQRPDVIEGRERLGDFEGDTMLLNGLERLYTLVDRKSGYLFVRHVLNGHAETIYQETLKIYRKHGDEIESITYDNGVEFSYHDLITLDTKITIYFAFPYHSWERGTNENTNGLIRQYLPKGKIHGRLKKSDIGLIEDKLNNRPRKRLNYLTPYEVFVKNRTYAHPTTQ
ncbi:MAG: IS30 family transposase [bacterium]